MVCGDHTYPHYGRYLASRRTDCPNSHGCRRDAREGIDRSRRVRTEGRRNATHAHASRASRREEPRGTSRRMGGTPRVARGPWRETARDEVATNPRPSNDVRRRLRYDGVRLMSREELPEDVILRIETDFASADVGKAVFTLAAYAGPERFRVVRCSRARKRVGDRTPGGRGPKRLSRRHFVGRVRRGGDQDQGSWPALRGGTSDRRHVPPLSHRRPSPPRDRCGRSRLLSMRLDDGVPVSGGDASRTSLGRAPHLHVPLRVLRIRGIPDSGDGRGSPASGADSSGLSRALPDHVSRSRRSSSRHCASTRCARSRRGGPNRPRGVESGVGAGLVDRR